MGLHELKKPGPKQRRQEITIRRAKDRGWILTEVGEHEALAGPFAEFALAEQARDKMISKRTAVKRPCLRCERPFMSEGIGNRLCKECNRDPMRALW